MHDSVFSWGRFKSTLLFSLSNTLQMRAEESGVVRAHTHTHYMVCLGFSSSCVPKPLCTSDQSRTLHWRQRNTSPWLWCFSWHHLKAVFVPCSRWKNQSLTATIQVRQQPKRNQDCSLQGRRCLFSCLLQNRTQREFSQLNFTDKRHFQGAKAFIWLLTKDIKSLNENVFFITCWFTNNSVFIDRMSSSLPFIGFL